MLRGAAGWIRRGGIAYVVIGGVGAPSPLEVVEDSNWRRYTSPREAAARGAGGLGNGLRNGGGIFGPRIVAGEPHEICKIACHASHSRPLRSITVAATSNNHDDSSSFEFI